MPYDISMDGYGVITPLPLSADEVFEHAGETTLASSTIKDFWQWAYSDLVGNTDRGTLAEYIVAFTGDFNFLVMDAGDGHDSS